MATAATQLSNTFDSKIVKPLVEKIDNYQADLLTEHSAYMTKCKAIRKSIAGVVLEVKARIGVDPKTTRAYLKLRDKQAKANAVFEELESEERETVEQLAHAFGDAADFGMFRHKIEQVAAATAAANGKTGVAAH